MPTPTTAQILAAARSVASKGYAGGAFISDVAAHLGTTVADLAPALFAGMRAQTIELRRADLVGAMDGAKVQASEIPHPMLRSAVYHFVVVG